MKTIVIEFGRSIIAAIFFALIVCGIYPVVIYGLGQIMFPLQEIGRVLFLY